MAAVVVLLASAPQAASAQNSEPEKPSGPAPVHDVWGMWTGPNEGLLSNRVPTMTPAGRAKLDANIPDPFSASSNDPWKTCDPFGMPPAAPNREVATVKGNHSLSTDLPAIGDAIAAWLQRVLA